MLVHPSLVSVAVDTLKTHLGYSEGDIKRRVVIMARSNDIPPEVARQGLLNIDSLLDDCLPVASLPERFDGDDAETIASIYFSSGALRSYNVSSNPLT